MASSDLDGGGVYTQDMCRGIDNRSQNITTYHLGSSVSMVEANYKMITVSRDITIV